jgi:hypothetical protein
MNLKLALRFAPLAAAVLLYATGCDKHDHDHDHDHAHTHAPKFGGKLIELGDHFANLEILLDPVNGKLLAYLLDGHAENPVAIEQDALAVTLDEPAGKTLSLAAQKGGVTGSATHFEGADDALKGLQKVRGKLTEVKAKGKVFQNLAFEAAPPKPAGK